jgi:hypothetical protein
MYLFNGRPPLGPSALLIQVVADFGKKLVQQGIGIEFMLRLSCHRCRRWRSLGTPNLPGVFNGPVYDAELMNGLVEDVKVGSSPSTVPGLILCGSLIQQ